MKTYVQYFVAIAFVFSFYSFGQSNGRAFAPGSIKHAITKSNDTAKKEGLVIVGYFVEETINMTFGRRITKYEVSKLEMVNTYDLGPNNTRVVTPIYRKPKIKTVDVALQSKTFVDSTVIKIEPVKVEVIAVTEAPKYLTIDVVDTYAKVLDKGYKSVEMLIKVADRAYFDGDLVTAAKYYEELIGMNSDLYAMYYYRYAESLKGINEIGKANETMLLFESKNVGNNVVRHNKLVRN
ncbi:hypothetical protein NJT12_20090 [Flavobacterium sp. AC]|uniref:Uncharacterized protein n=1 Tax=Flavobacterium azizsancarii TaxID=2961580 RepID=A0ABT4WI92_9FLAO|nr:hypothetical protein [Flavobacterium azizsancarii]MDA6071927.1 hypothetical protein [Flavobacterium azizsancarii]